MKTSLSRKDADKAHELREELKEIKLATTEHFFRTGEILKEVRDEGLWRAGWHSFEAWWADPELSMRSSSVYHSIKLVETFPKWKELLKIPVSKLIAIAPHVTEKNKSDLLVAAKALSRSDLRHELLSHGLEPERIKETPLPKIYKCNTCKGTKGVRWNELCHCGWSKKQIEHVGMLVDKIDLGG